MQERQPADMLIEARWVLPVAPRAAPLADHAVAVRDGYILAVGPRTELAARYDAREHIVRGEHALLPGFVNAHTRAGLTLLRGRRGPQQTAQGLEEPWLSRDMVRDGTRIAVAEMLRAGITAFATNDLYPEEAARIAAAARIRAAIGLPFAESATVWAQGATAHLERAERLWDEYKSDPWVSLYFAPQTADGIDDATLARLRTVADELDARVAMPVHQSESEIRHAIARGGRRPLRRLNDLGLLRPGFTALHMTQLEPAELELAARTGIAVVACTQANLRLGHGAAPVRRLLDHGVAVGLGGGSPATGLAFDALAETRAAALLAAGLANGTEPLSGEEALRLATLGGAAALGIGSVAGSLEAGKAADMIAIDLSGAPSQAAHAPADAVVFAATRDHVSDVWIGGRACVAEHRLLTYDIEELRALEREWDGRLPASAPAQRRSPQEVPG
jgi:5-methylthioadenosine/S-adenosylhomocysteine deaminase